MRALVVDLCKLQLFKLSNMLFTLEVFLLAASFLLWLAVIIILIWLFGWLLLPALGAIIHILIIIAIIIVIVWLLTGRRP
jgi:hypothetical protein